MLLCDLPKKKYILEPGTHLVHKEFPVLYSEFNAFDFIKQPSGEIYAAHRRVNYINVRPGQLVIVLSVIKCTMALGGLGKWDSNRRLRLAIILTSSGERIIHDVLQENFYII